MQALAQGLLSLAVVAVILTLGWYSSSGHREDRDHPAPERVWGLQHARWASHRERLKQRSEEIASMPAYQEMQRTLRDLDIARPSLLTHAASGVSEAASEAAHEYRQAIQAVQTRARDLRTRLTSEEYDLFWASFFAELNEDEDDLNEPLIESRLGILTIRGE
jgi:hypothetical protein